MLSTFQENLAAAEWFDKQSLNNDDWSELYSLYEHMRDKKGIPWEAMQMTLEGVATLMMENKWHE